MRATNSPCSPIHGPAEANTDPRRFRRGDQLAKRRLDLLSDTSASLTTVNLKAVPRLNFNPVPDDDLQLRPPDLNPKILHARIVIDLAVVVLLEIQSFLRSPDAKSVSAKAGAWKNLSPPEVEEKPLAPTSRRPSGENIKLRNVPPSRRTVSSS